MPRFLRSLLAVAATLGLMASAVAACPCAPAGAREADAHACCPPASGSVLASDQACCAAAQAETDPGLTVTVAKALAPQAPETAPAVPAGPAPRWRTSVGSIVSSAPPLILRI